MEALTHVNNSIKRRSRSNSTSSAITTFRHHQANERGKQRGALRTHPSTVKQHAAINSNAHTGKHGATVSGTTTTTRSSRHHHQRNSPQTQRRRTVKAHQRNETHPSANTASRIECHRTINSVRPRTAPCQMAQYNARNAAYCKRAGTVAQCGSNATVQRMRRR